MVKFEELKICYIEQFGFDVEFMEGLHLGTVLRLMEIKNEPVEAQKR